MATFSSRRRWLAQLGLSVGATPFLGNLQSIAGTRSSSSPAQRLIILFTPNGIVPKSFWPETWGTDFELSPILAPLAPFRDRLLLLRGVHDKIRGDGDNHMRGMGCLLTGIELFPGNIQGGSHTPAGWAKGCSIDQELRRFLQKQEATRTRFGSLEFGVMVPDRADPWTRLSYEGPNRPLTPIDNPKQMFEKLYGSQQDAQMLTSILDDVREDLKRIEQQTSSADRHLLREHLALVRSTEEKLLAMQGSQLSVGVVPKIPSGLAEHNDSIPEITEVQIDLLINAMMADMTRIATFQFTNSVGQARMRWLEIEEGHHELSHEPDDNQAAQEKLVKINRWHCEQIAYLAHRLQSMPEPTGDGTMLDHTTIVWTNELGKGNSHTLENIPFVMVGGGLGFQTGRAVDCGGVAHNRLLMSIAHAFGHHIPSFGNPEYCEQGPLIL
jgi:hypothetical protein